MRGCSECAGVWGDATGVGDAAERWWRVVCDGCGRYQGYWNKRQIEEASKMARELTNEPGQGILFQKRPSGRRPNWEGGVNINGVEYRVAGWDRRAQKSGTAFISLKVEPARREDADDQTGHDPF